MAVLATTEDVENALGRSLTTDESNRADALLLLASATVEDVTRGRFAAGPYTVGRRVRSGKVRVPGKAESVDEVRAIDQVDGSSSVLVADTDYTTRGRTIFGLGSWQFVEVDFTVSDDVPTEVAGIVAGIVASTISGPAVGVSAESAGTLSVSYVNSSGKVWLAASDKAILRRYCEPRYAIEVLA